MAPALTAAPVAPNGQGGGRDALVDSLLQALQVLAEKSNRSQAPVEPPPRTNSVE